MPFLKKQFYTLLVILMIVAGQLLTAQQLTINEFMSSNGTTIADEDGDFEDWIEIFNSGNVAVNLLNYGLSDDADTLFKWTFPEFILQPGHFLLVWASGKDRRPNQGELGNGLLREVYTGIPGSTIPDLINHPNYPDNPTSRNIVKNLFEAPTNVGDHYGQRMSGWIQAPATGQYIFWISSDDNSELHLSTTSSPDDLVLIAHVPGWTNPRQWNKFSQQQSAPINLQQGEYYYVMALMKEHLGGDNLAVGWQLPGGALDRPVTGQYLFSDEGELHTNFSIKSDGEELFLVHPDGTVLDEVEPVAVPTNISFGRSPDGADEWYYFDEPTPGESNTTQGYGGISASPIFLQEGGLYTEPFSLTLEAEPGAVIYYTNNGNTPTPTNGIIYTQPIAISQTVMIRAKAYLDGHIPSQTQTMIYSRISEQLQGFKSNLPLIILHQFNTPITPGDRTPATAVFIDHNQGDSAYLPGDIALQSRIIANIRGHSSQMFPKKMFGFHLLDDEDGTRDESLFGMPTEHNWILNAPYSDKTLMRNVIAYNTGSGSGRYAPRTRFVELFLHSGSGAVTTSHYHGVYVLVERIKWGEDRVNITKITPGDDEEPEITGGYIIKRDRLNDGEQGMTTDMGTNLAFVRPNESDITIEQKNWIRNYINDFETVLFSPDFTNPETGYENYIDTDSFLEHFLITELFKEIDGYRLSTFMYKDRNGKLVMGPVWDFNLSLGNANYAQGWMTNGWYYPLVSNIECTHWFIRLLDDDDYVDRMQYRWWQLRQDLFSTENLTNFIYQNKELLAEAQVRNFQRWPVLGQYVWPNWYVGQTYDDEVNWMHQWLLGRIAWVDSQMGEPPVFPDYQLVYYWLLDTSLPNDTPIESIDAFYSFSGTASLSFESALAGYPFDSSHPNWRKASMERRNAPTPVNYRPDGNDSISYENSNLRGIQVKQPFVGDGGENTLIISMPTNGFKEVVFSFASKDEGAADNLLIDYSVEAGEPLWTSIGIENPAPALSDNYQLFTFDFKDINEANHNPDFKIRIRFDGADMTADEGNRVTFNNISLDGVQISGGNLPPVVAEPLALQEVIEGGEEVMIDLNSVFSDPDGDPLSFTAASNHSGMVEVMLNGSMLTIIPVKRGGALITVTATDGNYSPVSITFRTLVYPEAYPLKNAPFSFTTWYPDEPDYAYPQNMLFLQSATNDPGIADDLLFPYFIPYDDYHPDDTATIGFPYNNTRRTRINGHGNEGMSFINTGRGRDAGGVLLALDTRNVTAAGFDWLGGTILQNERVYAIRLQYRSDINEPFVDLMIDNQIIEYVAGPDGEVMFFENMNLPSDAIEEDYLQLLWRYYHMEGDTGARAQLRLDNIYFEDLTSVGISTANQLHTSISNGAVYVHLSEPVNGNIAVYDIAGRIVKQQYLHNANQAILNLHSRKGVFILRVDSDHDQWVSKILLF